MPPSSKKTTEPSPASASVSKYMCLPGTGFGLECPENTHKRTLPRNVHFPVDFFNVKKIELNVLLCLSLVKFRVLPLPALRGRDRRRGLLYVHPAAILTEGGKGEGTWMDGLQKWKRKEGRKAPSRSRLHTNSRSMEQLPYGKQGEEDEEGKATLRILGTAGIWSLKVQP